MPRKCSEGISGRSACVRILTWRGTDGGMDFLWDADLSDLMSDEGPLFGHQGIAAWSVLAEHLVAWLIRLN